MSSTFRLPSVSKHEVRHIWALADADRPLLRETTPVAPKRPLREFRANHVEVRVRDGKVVNVQAAGVVQHDGHDSPSFTSEQWHLPPWPDSLAEFIGCVVERPAHPAKDVADAVYEVVVDHPMWIDDDGKPLEYSPEREGLIGQFCEQAAAKVLAAAGRAA